VADVQKCCEVRLADTRKFYEERIAELREMQDPTALLATRWGKKE
jgi:hypothetical protein